MLKVAALSDSLYFVFVSIVRKLADSRLGPRPEAFR